MSRARGGCATLQGPSQSQQQNAYQAQHSYGGYEAQQQGYQGVANQGSGGGYGSEQQTGGGSSVPAAAPAYLMDSLPQQAPATYYQPLPYTTAPQVPPSPGAVTCTYAHRWERKW